MSTVIWVVFSSTTTGWVALSRWPPLTVYYLHTQLPSVSHYIAAICLLLQGDIIAITKKIDDNWYQGYLGDQKGIFPSAYVEVLEGTHMYTGMEYYFYPFLLLQVS